MHNLNLARSKFCTIQIWHDPNFAQSKRGMIQILHNPNITPSKFFTIQNPLFYYNFIYQRSIVMGCACLDMIRIFFLFFWGEITTVHKWQLGRKAKNSLRPEEQYHTNWWSVRKFKENFSLDWVQSKIQQTKLLVTCQRFGDWFLFGLVWPYSSNQKNIMKVGSKSLLLTCSSNKLWAYLYYIFLIRRAS